MMDIQKILFENADSEYAAFQAKLTPGVDPDAIIGIRIPILRKIAETLKNTPEAEKFMSSLPHKYYDENMLHSILISHIKDYDSLIKRLDEYLPYVDNWAACDTISPVLFKRKKQGLLEKIDEWMASEHEFTCRYGIKCLMNYYLDDDFDVSTAAKVAEVRSDKYYINMMVAWYFATALAKQWDAAIPFIVNHSLDKWTHNKSIQKARESYRITDEQKEYLKSLKV